jgi:hypothetical protein
LEYESNSFYTWSLVAADVVDVSISRPRGSDARRWRDALGFAFAEATSVINREDFQLVERAIKDFHFVDQPNISCVIAAST